MKLYQEQSTWWVTGASSGIGRSIALELARNKMRIAITARNTDALEVVATECLALGATSCLVAAADLTNPAEATSCYQKVINNFKTIDVLIANAGIYKPTEVKEFSTEDALYEMDLNYGAFVRCLGLVLPQMVEDRNGHVVGVSSVAGFRGLPRAAGYGASKAAMSHFLESLKLDVAPLGIKVTVVHPGFVKTPLTDKNDFPMPCLIDSETAAAKIVSGVQNGDWEIHFPWRFTFFMKFLRLLPRKLYFSLINLSKNNK